MLSTGVELESEGNSQWALQLQILILLDLITVTAPAAGLSTFVTGWEVFMTPGYFCWYHNN